MKFWILAENTAAGPQFEAEHGLSVLALVNGNDLLFDMGKTGLFARNAAKLGLSLDRVEQAVLSHGHYDHGGGLPAFLEWNHSAPVWVQRRAFERHFSHRPSGEEADIGLCPELLDHPQLRLIDGDRKIGPGMRLFSGVEGKTLWPSSNGVLSKLENGVLVPDDFGHEQHLLLEEAGKRVLLVGCSHCGIVNILQSFFEKTGVYPDVVIGGFHLSIPSAGKSEPPETVDQVGKWLKKLPCRYYTGHCTGEETCARLSDILGERLKLIHSGMVFSI